MIFTHISRTLKEAISSIYKGLMKYSGTTFILDSIEARLNKRKEENSSKGSSSTESHANH